jgi:hypothetical protein
MDFPFLHRNTVFALKDLALFIKAARTDINLLWWESTPIPIYRYLLLLVGLDLA